MSNLITYIQRCLSLALFLWHNKYLTFIYIKYSNNVQKHNLFALKRRRKTISCKIWSIRNSRNAMNYHKIKTRNLGLKIINVDEIKRFKSILHGYTTLINTIQHKIHTYSLRTDAKTRSGNKCERNKSVISLNIKFNNCIQSRITQKILLQSSE